jgi:hypothetical protein
MVGHSQIPHVLALSGRGRHAWPQARALAMAMNGSDIWPPAGEAETLDLRQQVELTLLTGIEDITTVIEWQRRGTRFSEVLVASSSRGARAWIEAHYEDVEWENPIHASTLIGRLVDEPTGGGFRAALRRSAGESLAIAFSHQGHSEV